VLGLQLNLVVDPPLVVGGPGGEAHKQALRGNCQTRVGEA
jgi:hypothetical protein